MTSRESLCHHTNTAPFAIAAGRAEYYFHFGLMHYPRRTETLSFSRYRYHIYLASIPLYHCCVYNNRREYSNG